MATETMSTPPEPQSVPATDLSSKNVIPMQPPLKKNRIQVSNTKKPLFFYVNLAKKYIQQHNEVELSALGMAITTVVTIAEILKNNGLAKEKKVLTSTVGMKDENKGRFVQKAKIEIVLGKTEKFDSLLHNNKVEKSKEEVHETTQETKVAETKVTETKVAEQAATISS